MATTEGVTAFATETKLSLIAFRLPLLTTGAGPPSLTSPPPVANPSPTPPLKFDTSTAPNTMPTVTSTSDVNTLLFIPTSSLNSSVLFFFLLRHANGVQS